MYLLTDIYVGYRFADAQMLEEAQVAHNEAGEAFGSSPSPDSLHGPDNSPVIGHA
jgi:hypothetical protein